MKKLVGMVIFSCPKEFKGATSRLQRNAVKNWIRIGATPHLAGPERDILSVPTDLNIKSTVVENPTGLSPLPMFCDILNVSDLKSDAVQCYANADIIFPDVFTGFRSENGRFYLQDILLPEEFLIVGSRWDFQKDVEYDPAILGDSRGAIGNFICQKGATGEVALNNPDAMDYFIFTPDLFRDLRPLIVGRGGYDNALIAYCLRRRVPVIDVSRDWPVLHQFHGYGHKKGGKKEVYLADEAMLNRNEHDIKRSPPNALDSDLILQSGKLISSPWRCGFFRRLELTFRYRWGLKRISYLFRALQRFSGERGRVEKREMGYTGRCIAKLANS